MIVFGLLYFGIAAPVAAFNIRDVTSSMMKTVSQRRGVLARLVCGVQTTEEHDTLACI
jgi:hypothetical protein